MGGIKFKEMNETNINVYVFKKTKGHKVSLTINITNYVKNLHLNNLVNLFINSIL